MSETRLVALLRGVNVGGKHRVPMRELVDVFSAAGCTDSQTYIQSGNVVFRSGCDPAQLQASLAAAIEERFGFAVPVVVRTADALRAVLECNPFDGSDDDLVSVMFLRDVPAAEIAARLEPSRFLPERFAHRAGEIYLHMPNGAGRSKLTSAYFDGRLQTVGTVRNLRTLRALLAMA